MRNRGLKGVSGEPHWKVGRDVRRRTSLESAGGYRGTGETMLGLAESGVMVYMANQAKRGTPLIRDDIEGILRDVAIKLGCTATATGQLYTPLTDVRKLTDAFLVRCKELGAVRGEGGTGPSVAARAGGNRRDGEGVHGQGAWS